MKNLMTYSHDPDQTMKNGQFDSSLLPESLVRNYFPYLHRLAAFILGDEADASDACQETFIDALLHIDRYQPGTNLKAWLSKIAVHKCQAILRKRKAAYVLTTTIQAVHDLFSRQPSTLEMAVENESNSQLWTAVNSLDDKHRIPVILFYLYDYSTREISQILEISDGTVSSRLHYALKKLNNRLKDLERSEL